MQPIRGRSVAQSAVLLGVVGVIGLGSGASGIAANPSTSSPSSPYGSVDRATIDTLPKGLHATFMFASRPSPGTRLQIVWFLDGTRLVSSPVPIGDTVSSLVRTPGRPTSGTWKATLRAKPPYAAWRTVKEIRLRVE